MRCPDATTRIEFRDQQLQARQTGRSDLDKKKGQDEIRKEHAISHDVAPPGTVPWIQRLVVCETTVPIGVRQSDFPAKLRSPRCNRRFSDQHPGLTGGLTNHAVQVVVGHEQSGDDRTTGTSGSTRALARNGMLVPELHGTLYISKFKFKLSNKHLLACLASARESALL